MNEEQTEPVDNPAEDAGETTLMAPPQAKAWENAPAKEAVNLVPQLLADAKGAEWLEKEAKRVLKAIKRDDDSREDWKKARADEYKMYAGIVERVASGNVGAAPHDPIGTRILLQLWSRGCDQVVPQKGTLVQVQPNKPEDIEAAARREKRLNWQLRHKVPNWVRGVRMSYLLWLISGSTFREKMWDPVLKTTRIESIDADDVIVNYARRDVDPFMAEVPRVTIRKRLHRWTVEEYGDAGMFDPKQVAKLYDKETPSVSDEEDESVIQEVGDKIDNFEKPNTTSEDKELLPRTFYRCHTWVQLPDQKRMKPVIFTIDRRTAIPIALTVREDEDPFDKMRFDAEQKEWEIAAQNVAMQYQQAVAQAQAMGAPPPPQPQPPKAPAPVRMQPIHNVLHYRLFYNPAGFYGIGVGYLLKNGNLLIDKLELEYLLSARFNNNQGGLLPKGTNQKRGAVELEMGKWHETELEPEQMAGIKPFNFHPPSDGMWKFIGKMRDDCSTLIADADTLSGEAGPTNETKAAAEQRNYNATALVSTITGLFTETLAEEVKLIAHDNRAFMQEREEFFFEGQPQESLRSDWVDEFHFTFTADQRMQTRPERIQAATATLQQLSATPALVNDPNRGPQVMYAAVLEYFRALEKPELEAALGQPPQPPPPPQQMSQEDENAGFLNEADHPVFPEDPHVDHISKMDEFASTDYYANMSPSGKTMFDKHRRGHVAELYKQDAARANAERMGTGQGMGGGPGYQGMAGPPQGAPPGPPAPAGGPGIQ